MQQSGVNCNAPARLSVRHFLCFVAVWLAMATLPIGQAQGRDAEAPLLGSRCPDWPELRWAQHGPVELSALRGKVVLIRFFTSSDCPYCRRSARALRSLHRDLGPRGLVVIGMFTPKPEPRPLSIAEVRGYVREYGFEFPVAVDDEWKALRALWLDRVQGAGFTSASLLIDAEGVVRHVHPGGALASSGTDAKAKADYEALRAAIEDYLPEVPRK